VLQARERAPIPCFSVVFNLDSHFESIKKLGGVSPVILVTKILIMFLLTIVENVQIKHMFNQKN
jgi:hypothetical protein